MKITNNYEGASIRIEEIDNKKNEAILSIKKEGKNYGYYYNFCVSSGDNVATIHIKNFEESSYYEKGNIPVPYIRDKKEWKKINKENFNSNDDKDIIITVPKEQEWEISLFPRYSRIDLENFLNTIKGNSRIKIKEDPIKEIVIGDKSKPTIVIIARQHPGETLSSFFIEGIVEKIIYEEKYLDNNCFMIFPIVSTNGVKNGNHRLTDGIDYNRSWAKERLPEEIEYIQKRMNQCKVKMFIDVHCDEITNKDYIRTNNKIYGQNIAGIQVLEDMGKIRRFLRALIKQRKVINFSNLTAREYVSKKYKCDNMLIELTLKEDAKEEKNKGKDFIEGVLKNG